MSEVHRVTVQLRGSSLDDPGQITDGFYVIEGDTLIMTHPDGRPVDGFLYRAHLRPESDTVAIAGILTKDVRRGLMGITEKEDAFFNRPLNYGNSGIA